MTRFQTKIILLLLILFSVFGGLSLWLTNQFTQKAMEKEAIEKGVILTQSLAELIAKEVVAGQVLPTQETLIQVARRTKYVKYIYVIGFDGYIFTHSFEQGFPRALIHHPHKRFLGNQPYLQHYLTTDGHLLEVSYPLIEGTQAHLHIGFDCQHWHEQNQLLQRRVLFSTSLVAIISLVIGIWLSCRLSFPLKRLANSMQAFGQGDLGQALEFSGHSREIAELTCAFNSMITERKQIEERLRQSEGKLKAMIMSIGDHMSMIDRDFNILWANETARRLFGDDIVGCKCYEAYHHRNKPCEPWPCFTQRAFEDGQTHQNTAQVIGKDGQELFFLCSTNVAWRDAEGKPTAVIEISRDITEQVRAENRLRQSEQKYKHLYNNALVGLFRTRLSDGQMIECNEPCAILLGYENQDECQAHFVASEHYLDPVARLKIIEQVKKVGEVKNYETIATKKDGTPFWVCISAHLYREEGYLEGVVIDISRQQQAKEALRRSEERYRDLVENLNEVIYVLDENGLITYLSPVIVNLTGFLPSELIGKSFLELVQKEDRRRMMTSLRRILAGRYLAEEFRLKTTKDDLKWASISNRLIPSSDGSMTIRGVLKDITEMRKMQDELVKMHKLESLGLLAGGIAHDFNNLLAGLLSNLCLAIYTASEQSEHELVEMLTEAEKAGRRAKELTQRLLTFAKGGLPVKKVASIKDLLHESADFLLRGSKAKGTIHLSDHLWAVEIDEGQMSQVINNLILNAEQAMPNGGLITLSAESVVIDNEDPSLPLPSGQYIKISVQDEGVGITAENLGRIFDPYFTTKPKGTGLGLTICYSIVKNHHGHLTVESELGLGTTFSLYLPASSEMARQERQIDDTVMTGQGRILIMDDEEILRTSTGKILGKIGYSTSLAGDGQEALDLYKQAMAAGQPFDLVIMDLTIPGGKGGKWAIEKFLIADPKAKVLVASGYSNDPIMADYRTYGFCGFLTKPFTMKELSQIVRQAISEKIGCTRGAVDHHRSGVLPLE